MSMSTDDQDVAQEILDSYSRLLVENYCIIASSVLLFTDWLMSFTDEVQRIWGRRFTGATLVFLLTRYTAVAERIVLVVSLFLPTVQDASRVFGPFPASTTLRSQPSCVPVLRLDDTLTDISYLIFGIFMMLRARGIWGKGWLPIVFLAILTPARTAITLYVQVHYVPLAFGAPLYGCGAVFYVSPSLLRACEVGIASRASALTIDTTVLVLTWIRTLRLKRDSYRLGLHTPMVTLLLRDGTFYFVIILFIQVFSIVSTAAGSEFILWDVFPYFDQVFTVVFSCRFMLDLRGVYLRDASPADPESTTRLDGAYTSAREVSALRFTPNVVGNLGAPLSTLAFADDRDDDEDEKLDASSDPLRVGLHHPDCVEMLETPSTARS
ncbi:hypothetical protein BD413DRAFT_617180 [Trametes elegans]|nr:hypothetical protein BD413DRAFT_617180 [Trametes elegans]